MADAESRKRILIITADPSLQAEIEDNLALQGFHVDTVRTPADAIARIERERVDIVILDMVMPEMEGKQCLDRLLKIDPDVKVIISSGYSLDAEEREHLGAFVSGFVNKPYEVGQLVQKVKEALGVRHLPGDRLGHE